MYTEWVSNPDPAKHAAYMRAWRAGNIERAREIGRAGSAKYNAAHPERRAESVRKYAEKLSVDVAHHQREAKRAQRYRGAHPETVRESSRRYVARIAADPVLRAEKNAKHRAWYAKHVAEHPDYLARKRESAQRYREADPARVAAQLLAANRRYHEAHPDVARDLRRRKRSEVLAFFGGVCGRCGLADPETLHVDHIHGGGGKERKAGAGTVYEQHRLITTDPDAARAKYQLLCANCHARKGR